MSIITNVVLENMFTTSELYDHASLDQLANYAYNITNAVACDMIPHQGDYEKQYIPLLCKVC